MILRRSNRAIRRPTRRLDHGLVRGRHRWFIHRNDRGLIDWFLCRRHGRLLDRRCTRPDPGRPMSADVPSQGGHHRTVHGARVLREVREQRCHPISNLLRSLGPRRSHRLGGRQERGTGVRCGAITWGLTTFGGFVSDVVAPASLTLNLKLIAGRLIHRVVLERGRGVT